MSLTGSLSTMPLAEVLGWIGATDRLGVLNVRGVGSETMLLLRGGRVVECAALDPPVLLGQFLLFHGVIDEEVLDQAMRAHVEQGRRLGDVLLDTGAVSSEDMQEALRAKAEETVLSSFDRPTGWFTFDPHAASLEEPLTVDMSITDAIARGDTRVKSAADAGSSVQLSFATRVAPLASCNSSVGSARTLFNPNWLSDGPMPRKAIRELTWPLPRIKPPIITLLPFWTKPRVLMLASCESEPALLSYTSTMPTPVVLFLPVMIAV